MLKFVFGALFGAAAYWAYRFWKGEDSSWDSSFGSTGDSSAWQPAGTGASTATGASSSTPGAQPTPE
jgi:hypothetical protein